MRPKRIRLLLLIVLGVCAAVLVSIDACPGAPAGPARARVAEPLVPSVDDSAFSRLLELVTGTHLDAGNRVDVLLNGDGLYPRLWRDLSGAQRTIAMQMYYVVPGAVTDTLAMILCERAKAGVRVLFMRDAFGAVKARRSWLERMRRCGVEVATLRPLQWATLHTSSNRSHVRAVIVDGRIGYTGGFGLADYWMGDGLHEDAWRETNVRFEGPAVGGLQAAFGAAWAEVTGELLVDHDFLPLDLPRDTSGTHTSVAGVLFTASSSGRTAAERFITLAIRGAQRRLYITNSYFVPGPDFRAQLTDAADRGVDVRILTASANTDVRTPWLAGRSYYDELRAHGVRIYEYLPAMMHAKTLVVDGAWGAIGSLNFDNRSLALNDEVNLVVMDSVFGARMDSVFLADLTHSREMTPAVQARRRWWMRVLERGAAAIAHLL